MMPVRRLLRSKRRKFRILQLRDEHGRHPVDGGATFRLHPLQYRSGVEMLAGDHQTGPHRDTQQVGQHHAEAVIEGHRYTKPVLLAEVHGLGAEPGIVEQIVVGQQHRLGEAGGARGVLDIDRIVPVEARGDIFQLCPAHLGPGRQQRLPGGEPGGR